MSKILFTGGTGFIGKNIIPILSKKHTVIAPARSELNLFDPEELSDFVRSGEYDVIFHTANPNPIKNSIDVHESMFNSALRMHTNIMKATMSNVRLIYIGSGAEYDKRRDIIDINEEDVGDFIPADDYGFAKYIINEMRKSYSNIYNLRLFACFGPYDHSSKFITHVINCCMECRDVTIRQDCYFDYLHVTDLAKIADFFIDGSPRYNDYNTCSGEKYLLSEIARKVINQMGVNAKICIQKSGLNKEYTANNDRLLREMRGIKILSIDEGIEKQIAWMQQEVKNEKARC